MNRNDIVKINALTNELTLWDGTVVPVPDVNRYMVGHSIELCDEMRAKYEAGEPVHVYARVSMMFTKHTAPFFEEEMARVAESGARAQARRMLHMVGAK